MLSEEHSGIKITYSENHNKWVVEDDENEISLMRDSLLEAKKAIDNILRNRRQGKFKRFTALRKGMKWDSGPWAVVTVTSITETKSSFYGRQCWIAYPKTKELKIAEREKVYSSTLYGDTPQNMKLIIEINEKLETIKNIEKEIEKLESQMTKMKIDDENEKD